MAIRCYRGSVGNLVLEMRRREKRLDKEHWKYPGLPLPEETRAGVRRVLGFFIGETPVDPLGPVPAPGAPARRCSAGCAGSAGCDRAAVNAALALSEPDARGRSMAGPAAPIRAAAMVMARLPAHLAALPKTHAPIRPQRAPACGNLWRGNTPCP